MIMTRLHIQSNPLVEQFIIPVYMIHAIINFVGLVYIFTASLPYPPASLLSTPVDILYLMKVLRIVLLVPMTRS